MAYLGAQRIELIIQAVDQASAKLRTIGRSTDEVKTSFKSLVVGISGVTTAAVSLYMSFDRIHHAQVSLDRANLMVQRSTQSLDQAQQNYNETIQKYGANSSEAKDAADKLCLAQEGLNVATERAQLASENVSQATLSFAVTIVPTVITAVAGLTTALKGMGIAASASLGPIGLIVGLATALGVEVYAMASSVSTATNRISEFTGQLTAMKIEVEKGIENTNKQYQAFLDLTTQEGKMVAAYREWYSLIKEDNKLWSDTAGQLRNDFNILQAQASTALQKIALEFDKALTGGNIDKATWVLLDFANTFGISIDDARKIIDDFLASLGQVPSVVEEISTQVTETIDPLSSLFDQLQSHWNLDKARELGSKYVEAYASNWKSGMIMYAMVAAKKFATDMNISLEDAVNILDELMDKLPKAEEAKAPTPFTQWSEAAKGFEWMFPEGSLPTPTITPVSAASLASTAPSVTVEINSPMVYVEGAADARTARLCAQLMKDALKNVVIEATSVNAPTSQKQIRLGSSTTSILSGLGTVSRAPNIGQRLHGYTQ